MTPKVGVFSVVIAVGIGALAFKGVDIAQAVAQQAEEAAAAPSGPNALTEAAEEAADPGRSAPPAGAAASPPTPEQCLSALDAAAEEAGLSSNEIIVLRSLQARREALDERELGITTREGATAAAEARLQEQITELKAVETQIQGLLSQMETKRDERMTSLVKTYEAMKPKDAAAIFNGMDDGVLLDIAKAMKPATLAAILSSMTPKRAEALTRMLADLAKSPVEAALAAKPPA
jgi:flagellar motility protein MotE (MotC chaperone)